LIFGSMAAKLRQFIELVVASRKLKNDKSHLLNNLFNI